MVRAYRACWWGVFVSLYVTVLVSDTFEPPAVAVSSPNAGLRGVISTEVKVNKEQSNSSLDPGELNLMDILVREHRMGTTEGEPERKMRKCTLYIPNYYHCHPLWIL